MIWTSFTPINSAEISMPDENYFIKEYINSKSLDGLLGTTRYRNVSDVGSPFTYKFYLKKVHNYNFKPFFIRIGHLKLALAPIKLPSDNRQIPGSFLLLYATPDFASNANDYSTFVENLIATATIRDVIFQLDVEMQQILTNMDDYRVITITTNFKLVIMVPSLGELIILSEGNVARIHVVEISKLTSSKNLNKMSLFYSLKFARDNVYGYPCDFLIKNRPNRTALLQSSSGYVELPYTIHTDNSLLVELPSLMNHNSAFNIFKEAFSDVEVVKRYLIKYNVDKWMLEYHQQEFKLLSDMIISPLLIKNDSDRILSSIFSLEFSKLYSMQLSRTTESIINIPEFKYIEQSVFMWSLSWSLPILFYYGNELYSNIISSIDCIEAVMGPFTFKLSDEVVLTGDVLIKSLDSNLKDDEVNLSILKGIIMSYFAFTIITSYDNNYISIFKANESFNDDHFKRIFKEVFNSVINQSVKFKELFSFNDKLISDPIVNKIISTTKFLENNEIGLLPEEYKINYNDFSIIIYNMKLKGFVMIPEMKKFIKVGELDEYIK